MHRAVGELERLTVPVERIECARQPEPRADPARARTPGARQGRVW
jgi:hypothetical protein